MFLKRIELKGFKSFADKTVIEFKSGITGVVGPNGSGKSNISDAVRWVLGEQSAKSLRGGKMEDIIFAGTNKRKPLGFAEVTLALDNADGEIPIEYEEVSVTRRVFRSGESEYYINKVSCRMRDIKELFMDTGIGEDGYSIVGQGRIDEILSTKSEGRRNIFEEASGIVKYKSRKEEAEKKLAKTEENLIRIDDIVTELEKQLGPLKTQSKKAVEYKTLAEDLKRLEINLYINEIMRVKEKFNEIDKEKEKQNKLLKEKQVYKSSLEDKYSRMKEKIETIDSEIETIKTKEYNTKSNIERKTNEINLTRERISHLEKEINRYTQEILDLRTYISQSQVQGEENEENQRKLKEKLESLDSNLESKTRAYKKLTGEIEEKEKYIEDKKSSVIETFNKIADKKSKINSSSSFRENIDKRLKQINDEIIDLELLKKDIEVEKKDLEEKTSNYKDSFNNITEKLSDRIKDKNDKARRLEEVNIELNNINSNLQKSTSRRNLLSDMSKEYEGYYKGVKNALKACDRDSELGRGVEGVLAELINVPKKFEKAVEIALGSSIQNIVIDTQENAKKIINHLKSKNLGRVTFLPIASMSARYLNNNETRLLNEDGVLGVGSEVLSYDSKYKRVIENLLGRVLFVEKIEDGIAVARKSNYSLRIVSLDGDVLNPGGSMTGGSLNNYNTKLLGRQREIDELDNQIKKLKTSYKDMSSNREAIEKDIKILDSHIEASNKTINETKLVLATSENKYEQICIEEKRNNLNIEKFLSEKDSLESENVSIEKDNEDIVIELSELEKKNAKTQEDIEDYIVRFEDEKSEKEKMQREITDLKISKASLEQEYKNILEAIDRLKEETNKSSSSIDIKEKEKLQVNKNIENFKQEISLNTDEKISLERELKDYGTKLKDSDQEKNNYIKNFNVEDKKLQAVNLDIVEIEKNINNLELKTEKHNLRYENFNNRLWEEYEMTFHMALDYKEDIKDLSETKDKVRGLNEKIKSLGNINLDSIEEYKDVKVRYEFMTGQIKDLTKAKDSLDAVIKEMYEKMTQQFSESFEIIRKNFILVFKELFGGGEADVYLTDKEDILSSGIEIVAQPPGKKLQSLLLLSGGERALTAIALLFAIIKTKPTPFCVLDEIEAALDEANVYRYAQYLKQFSSTTQFIAITHRKGTMENVDSLYGVTMEEEGVSKLVSIKLSDKDKVS